MENKWNDVFGTIFGYNFVTNGTQNNQSYNEKLNENIINELYNFAKSISQYKLFKMKSGDYAIYKGNEKVETFNDIIQAKKNFVIYTMYL